MGRVELEKIEMKRGHSKSRWHMKLFCLFICLMMMTIVLVGCNSKEALTKTERELQDQAKEKEKQEMAEKKILSDFQNKAYKIYDLSQLADLAALMDQEISKLSKDNAVVMLLNFELSQRMALQNDLKYGQVSEAFEKSVSKMAIGIVDLAKIKENATGELKKEIETIESGSYTVYKDESGVYRIVDYSHLQAYRSYMTDEYARYVDYMVSESTRPTLKNKRFNVDREEAWRRLVYLDTYFSDYPVATDDLLRNNLGRYYQDILKHTIYGDDLNPSFDPLTGQLSGEASAFLASHSFSVGSRLQIPFENYKSQLAVDYGKLTPAVGTHIQQLLRLSNEIVTDHID